MAGRPAPLSPRNQQSAPGSPIVSLMGQRWVAHAATQTPWAAAALLAVGLTLIVTLPLPWVLVGFTLGGIGVVLRPWLTLPAVVLTLPYHFHPKSFGGVELSIGEVTLLLGIAGAATRLLIDKVDGNHWPSSTAICPPRPSAVDLYTALFLLAAIISLAVTEYPKQSLREFRWLVVEPIAFFYLIRCSYTGAHVARVTLWSVAISGAAAAILSLATLAAEGMLANLSVRGTDPFLSPNHLGLFLGRAGSAALALLLFTETSGRKTPVPALASGLAFTTIAVGIVRTISLGAWAGFAATCLALTALRSRLLLLGTVAVLAIFVLGAAIALPPERIRARLDPEVGTAQSRLYVWGAAVRMIVDHPILGIGLDNFLYAYRSQYIAPEAWREPNLSHPHNWVLHFWVQLGMLGLAAASGLIVWMAVTAHRLFRHPSGEMDRAVAATVGGMLLSFLVHGSLDNAYFLVDAANLWWLSLGLLAVSSASNTIHPVLQSAAPKQGP